MDRRLRFYGMMGKTSVLSSPIGGFDEAGLQRAFSGSPTQAKFLEMSNTNGPVTDVTDSVIVPTEDQNTASLAIYSNSLFLNRQVWKYTVPSNTNTAMFFKIILSDEPLSNNPTAQYIYSIPNYSTGSLALANFFQFSTLVSDTANATAFTQVGGLWECKIPVTASFITSLNAGGTFSFLSLCGADKDDIYGFTGTTIIDGVSGKIELVFS